MLQEINENVWIDLDDVYAIEFEKNNTWRVYFRYQRDIHFSSAEDEAGCLKLKQLLRQNYENKLVNKK